MGFDSQGDKKFFLEDVSEPQDDSQSSKKYKIIGYLTPDSGDNNSIKLTCPLLEGGLAPKNQTVLITETLILVSGWDQEDFFSLIDDNDQMAVLIMSSGDVLVQFGPVFVKNLQVLDLDGVSRKLENIEGFSLIINSISFLSFSIMRLLNHNPIFFCQQPRFSPVCLFLHLNFANAFQASHNETKMSITKNRSRGF